MLFSQRNQGLRSPYFAWSCSRYIAGKAKILGTCHLAAHPARSWDDALVLRIVVTKRLLDAISGFRALCLGNPSYFLG